MMQEKRYSCPWLSVWNMNPHTVCLRDPTSGRRPMAPTCHPQYHVPLETIPLCHDGTTRYSMLHERGGHTVQQKWTNTKK